jgi:hypothetical protein
MAGWFDANDIPHDWVRYIPLLTTMVGLAALDFAGAIFAKESSEQNHLGFYIAGALAFLLLYVVYAHILKTAELSIVTIGWVVFLQVGLVLVDHFRYGVDFGTPQWLAIGTILLLQAYLVLAPTSSSTGS